MLLISIKLVKSGVAYLLLPLLWMLVIGKKSWLVSLPCPEGATSSCCKQSTLICMMRARLQLHSRRLIVTKIPKSKTSCYPEQCCPLKMLLQLLSLRICLAWSRGQRLQ